MNKANQGSKRDPLTKILPTLLGLTKRKVVGLHFLNLIAPNVERNTMGSAYPVRMIAMVVERIIIK